MQYFVHFGLPHWSYYCSTREAIKVISEVINISDNEEVLKCRMLNKLIFNLMAVLLLACMHFAWLRGVVLFHTSTLVAVAITVRQTVLGGGKPRWTEFLHKTRICLWSFWWMHRKWRLIVFVSILGNMLPVTFRVMDPTCQCTVCVCFSTHTRLFVCHCFPRFQ